MNRHLLTAGALALAFFSFGCPEQRVLCTQGLAACGQGCADLTSDRLNCGGCGVACQPGQVCQESACRCGPGTEVCGTGCAVLATDPLNCGACGNACGAGLVCEGGQCKSACNFTTSTLCGQSCVALGSDPLHCGACGNACQDARSCRNGVCQYDVVAACFSNGQVTGLQAQTGLKGPNAAIGTAPQSLAAVADVLLSLDGIDDRVYQASLAPTGAPFAQVSGAPTTGSVPNQVLAFDPYVYVVNASSGTLQVLRRNASTAASYASVDGGLQLATVAEVSFGANTFPEAAVKLGDAMYVPLYGGFGAAAASAGQRVVKVDITQPEAPSAVTSYPMPQGAALQPLPNGDPVARPWSITAHQGQLFVALSNLNPDTYVPEGNGMLARIDPVSGDVTPIDLGNDVCLNAVSVASDGQRLFVTCQGKVSYDPTTFLANGVEKAALVVVQADGTRLAATPIACPHTGDCSPIVPGRFALVGGDVFVADQNGGRVFVYGFTDGGLVERRGYQSGGPIQACAVDSTTGVSNVADLLALP